MTTTTRHPMSSADAAWLRMDKPTNLMVINSVMWFDDQPDIDDVRRVVEERLLAPFPRFRRRIVDDHGPTWEDDPSFDLDRHVRRVHLPPPGGRAELEELVASRTVLPLDREHPMWELLLVDGYGEGGVLVSRLHHCIADGISLMQVLLSLADEAETDLEVADEPASRQGVANRLRALPGGVAREAVDLTVHPRHVVDLVGAGVGDAAAAVKLLALPPDRHTPLRGRTTTQKQVAWSDPLPLGALKHAAHRSGATVNDLVLAAVSGAVRRELRRQDTSPVDVRAIVPFNLRPLDEPIPRDLGNRFGLVYLDLPVGTAGRSRRLAAMSERMTEIKNSAEGVVSYGILELVGQVPASVEKLAIQVFASKASAVMTNVPGPRHRVTMAGRTLLGTTGWPPMSGDIGLSVSVFSYAGEVTVGFMVDRAMVPDVRALLADFDREVGALTVEP